MNLIMKIGLGVIGLGVIIALIVMLSDTVKQLNDEENLISSSPSADTKAVSCASRNTSSSCTDGSSKCTWKPAVFSTCEGEGSEGWSCSYFKDVDNSANKCEKADGCWAEYTGNWGRNRKFSACKGFQTGTGHKCNEFETDEGKCSDREGCKPKYTSAVCADA